MTDGASSESVEPRTPQELIDLLGEFGIDVLLKKQGAGRLVEIAAGFKAVMAFCGAKKKFGVVLSDESDQSWMVIRAELTTEKPEAL